MLFKKRTGMTAAVTGIAVSTVLLGSLSTAYPQVVCAAEESAAKHEALTMMTSSSNDYTDFLAALEEKYPEINIELISYKGYNTTEYCDVVLEAGDLPDIFMTTYANMPEWQPERLIDLSGESFTAEFNSKLLSDASIDGSLYLLPVNVSLIGIYYNKTLFEEHGWEVPDSLEELEALIPQIEDAGVNLSECATKLPGVTFSWLFNVGATDYIRSLSGVQWMRDFLNGDAQASGNLDGTVELMQRWIDDGLLSVREPEDGTSVLERFKEGNTAFFVANSSPGYAQNEDGTGDEYGILPYLSVDGSNNVIITNVSMYLGLSKALENDAQKLEDAKKVMEFVASPEGQESLNTRDNAVSALKNTEMDENDPLYAVSALVDEGKSMELTYSGWEDYTVGVGTDVHSLIAGEMTTEEFLTSMDEQQAEIQEKGELPALATVEEDLSCEQAAQLVGAAFASAADADCALISLGDYHSAGMENVNGVNGKIYSAVSLTENVVSTFNPLGWTNTIRTMTLPGKTIREWAEDGYYQGDDPTPFAYVLVTRNGEELQDEKEYTVACVTESEERAAQGNMTDTGIVGQDALVAYIQSLETLNSETILWK